MALCAYDPYTLPTIDFVAGATQELVYHTYFERNGTPFDLAGCTANFSLVNYVNKHGAPLVSKTMTVEKEDDEPGTIANILRVILTPSDTVELEGKFIYQITIMDDDGEVEPPFQGIMRIANNINKKFVTGG